MKCPMCGGDFDGVTLKSDNNVAIFSKRCNQCNGFWFDRNPEQNISEKSVLGFDSAAPNYSLKTFDLVCPNDESLLQAVENEDLPAGSQYWRCPDCDGSFYPKGQLALITSFRAKDQTNTPVTSRSQAALTAILLIGGAVVANAAFRQGALYNAASDQVLPTAGPNALTLVLLALTYLAGTILAVLGRKLPIVLMGWGVISICLVGFFVVIFGP